jgi:hypothetical protein
MAGDRMNHKELIGIEMEKEVRKIEINIERVMIWSLVFTNLFAISYFFGRLLKWI